MIVGDTSGSALTSGLPSYSGPSIASSPHSFKDELISHLHIPSHLVGAGDGSLRFAYQKYKAVLVAVSTYNAMSSSGTWTIKRPTRTDIVGLFISKSFFHSHYKRYFSKVGEYEEMVAWLDEKEDRLSDLEVWGVEKSLYTFTDLAAWLEKGGSLEIEEDCGYQDGNGKKGSSGKGKGKGKEKGKGKGKESGKEKEKEKDEGKDKGKEKEKDKKKSKKKAGKS